jgi:hypothetical protein
MTTETTKAVATGWTAEEEAEIKRIQEATGKGRKDAIREMRSGKKVRVKHELGSNPVKVVEKVAKAKSKPEPKHKAVSDLPKTSSEQVKVNRDELDDVIRKALKEGYGHVCPVLGVLGSRFAVPSQTQGFPYYRVLADVSKNSNGSELVAVFVSGFYKGGPGATASIAPAVKSSYTVKNLLARIERRTKRDAAAAKGEAGKSR